LCNKSNENDDFMAFASFLLAVSPLNCFPVVSQSKCLMLGNLLIPALKADVSVDKCDSFALRFRREVYERFHQTAADGTNQKDAANNRLSYSVGTNCGAHLTLSTFFELGNDLKVCHIMVINDVMKLQQISP